ncbi:hypothetical protein SDC9_178831 [bioreactor metagenome]|uniref:Uncharacterized protein n=1 Tax=bioreactor metagenome TaxID=1076179 RepID=A0A645GXB3_9ZZZZ
MVGVSRHEDDGRWVWQLLDGLGQRETVLAGHVDVQQQHIHLGAGAVVLQHGQCLGSVGCFLHHIVTPAIGEQGTQAAAGQRFVIDDENVHSRKLSDL